MNIYYNAVSKKFQLFLSFITVLSILIISVRDILSYGITDKNSSLFSLGLLIYFCVFFLNYLDQKHQTPSFILKFFYSSNITPLIVSLCSLIFLATQNEYQLLSFPLIVVIALNTGIVVGPICKFISRKLKESV